MEKGKLIAVIFSVAVILIVASALFLKIDKSKTVTINDFESCVSAGYPVLESYPEQCKTPSGETFVKEYEFNYSEGLILMLNPEDGKYSCFGCGKTMCIDPAPFMELVPETEEFYCDAEFNVIDTRADYLKDGVSLYKNLETNEYGCFGCNNKLCVDIMINENLELPNETDEQHCSEDFEVILQTDIVLIERDYGNKIVYDMSQNKDNLLIDCNARGGTFNECGSPCSPKAEACILSCAFTCENIE